MKKAFLVKASVMTRIVIDVPNDYETNENLDTPTDDTIMEIALPRLKHNLDIECIEEIVVDTECPYDEFWDEYN